MDKINLNQKITLKNSKKAINFMNMWGMFSTFIIGLVFAYAINILINALIAVNILPSFDSQMLTLIKIISWIIFVIIFPLAMGFGKDNE